MAEGENNKDWYCTWLTFNSIRFVVLSRLRRFDFLRYDLLLGSEYFVRFAIRKKAYWNGPNLAYLGTVVRVQRCDSKHQHHWRAPAASASPPGRFCGEGSLWKDQETPYQCLHYRYHRRWKVMQHGSWYTLYIMAMSVVLTSWQYPRLWTLVDQLAPRSQYRRNSDLCCSRSELHFPARMNWWMQTDLSFVLWKINLPN